MELKPCCFANSLSKYCYCHIEIMKKQTQSKLVDMFMDSLSGSMDNQYTTKIDVSFEKREHY